MSDKKYRFPKELSGEDKQRVSIARAVRSREITYETINKSITPAERIGW